jgi:hypothetical protein
MNAEKEKDIDKVVDVNEMYGYENEQQQQQKQDSKAEILKAFLNHLNERKKLYLRRVD